MKKNNAQLKFMQLKAYKII